MSTDRSNNTNRPLRPTLASNRSARTPITPRVTTNVTPATRSTASKPSPTVRPEPITPRGNKATNTPLSNALANGNVTPRSSARSSRVGVADSPPIQKQDTPIAERPKSVIVAGAGAKQRNVNIGGLGISVEKQDVVPINRARSVISESSTNVRVQSPLVRSPGFDDLSQQSPQSSIDSRFFLASDAPKQQKASVQRPEPKKATSFFYADGKQEGQHGLAHEAASPVLSAVSEQRSTGPWTRSEGVQNITRSPPMLSPALSALSSASPFFAPGVGSPTRQRSPSPSKENIHLSYRKGASQIFGTRPAPIPRSTAASSTLAHPTSAVGHEGSTGAAVSLSSRHRKSSSLCSIVSVNSHQGRRHSAVIAEVEASSSPLTREVKGAPIPSAGRLSIDLPTIDTSLGSPSLRSPKENALSPTKGISELAADARRERKVLDLEISNSSLLAINTSLEREMRRQKAELKRFRRLSRAGRFSFAPGDPHPRVSSGLFAVGEDDEEDDSSIFEPESDSFGFHDDMSDDEESITSSADPLSPSAQSRRESDRLAKDERRLRVDLARHKDILVQSQAMNQSLKRCMYSTEEMIKEGKKALEYRVRVSDIKLGGRVLSNRAEDDSESAEVEVEDDCHPDDGLDQARGILDVWAGVGRPSLEDSEAGDRDSGIEVERPTHTSLLLTNKADDVGDYGRPPETDAARLS